MALGGKKKALSEMKANKDLCRHKKKTLKRFLSPAESHQKRNLLKKIL